MGAFQAEGTDTTVWERALAFDRPRRPVDLKEGEGGETGRKDGSKTEWAVWGIVLYGMEMKWLEP